MYDNFWLLNKLLSLDCAGSKTRKVQYRHPSFYVQVRRSVVDSRPIQYRQ